MTKNAVKLWIPLFQSKTIRNIQFQSTFAELQLHLNPTNTSCRSTLVKVGTFYESDIFARVTLTARYDESNNMVYVGDHLTHSSESLKLHLSIGQDHLKSYEVKTDYKTSGSPLDIVEEHLLKDGEINDFLVETRGKVAAAVLEQLSAMDFQHVVRKSVPLIVNYHNYLQIKTLLQKHIKLPDEASLESIRKLQPVVDSTYQGIVNWPHGTIFANVKGSSSDKRPAPYHNWIQIWEIQCNNGWPNGQCTSLNRQILGNAALAFQCSPQGTPLHGGHVLLGNQAQPGQVGGVVFLIPICPAHNNHNFVNGMEVVMPNGRCAVVLNNYMQ